MSAQERWEATPDGDGNHVIVDENGLVIATVWGPEDDSEAERKDARLMAAAPRLAEALQSTLPALIRLGDFIGNGENPGKVGIGPIDRCALIFEVREALAEAGVQP
jgi:hypothetical protein